MSKYRSPKIVITAPKPSSARVLAARPLKDLLDQWKTMIETTARYQGPHAAQCLQVAFDELKSAVQEAGRQPLRVDAEVVAKRIGRTAQAVTRLCRKYGSKLGASQLVEHGSWQIDLNEFLEGYRTLGLDRRAGHAQPKRAATKKAAQPQSMETVA